jgi:hypothetical protein
MIRIRSVAGLSVIAAASSAAVAAAATSHATLWLNQAGTVTCGIEIHATGHRASEVLCAATGIPAPPHTTSAQGDPGFVQLARSGKPVKLRLSQDSFVGRHSVTLGHGRTWSALGVTCTTGSGRTVLCFNADNHGFVIGNGHYTSF